MKALDTFVITVAEWLSILLILSLVAGIFDRGPVTLAHSDVIFLFIAIGIRNAFIATRTTN